MSPNAAWWAYLNPNIVSGALQGALPTKPGGDWKDWLNSRAHVNGQFAITLPTLVIPKDQKKATGTIILTPVDNDDRGLYNTYDDFTIPFGLDFDPSIEFDAARDIQGSDVYFRVDGVQYATQVPLRNTITAITAGSAPSWVAAIPI